MIELLKTNWIYIIGGIVGGVVGYLCWHFVGCSGGSCPITSSPVMSTIWGVLLGGLLSGMVFSKKSDKVDMKELLDNGALLLDVRTQSQYARDHAKISINIPMGELANSLHEFDKEQHIILVCTSGINSAIAVKKMKSNGFKNCYNGGSWGKFKDYER